MTRKKIQHKIAAVADELCEMCPQCHEGECRAYQVPHTDEERVRRESGMPLCDSSVFRTGYPQRA